MLQISRCSSIFLEVADLMHTCRGIACTRGGNAFNFNPNKQECNILRCSDNDLLLQDSEEGYHVYILAGDSLRQLNL